VFNDKIQHQINADNDSRNAILTTPGRLPALLVICRNAQTNLRANFKPSTLINRQPNITLNLATKISKCRKEVFHNVLLGAYRPVLVRNMMFGGLKGYSAGSRIRP
jgi:hypothetical protein